MPVARRREPIVYIPLDTAVQEHNLDREKLLQAIDEDDVEIAKLVDDTIIIVYESLRAWMARQIRRSQFAHLEDQEISVTEAAKKYGLSRRSIERWVERGYVRDRGIAPGYKRRRMVNEADVAYASALVEVKDPAQGQAVFEA